MNTSYAVLYNATQTVFSITASQQISQAITTSSFTNLSTGNNDKRYLYKIDKVFAADNFNYRATESVNTFDAYGNIILNVLKKGTLSANTVTPIETMNTTTVYSTQNTPVPAKPDNVTITKTRSGQAAVSSKTSYTYNIKGLVFTEKLFDGLTKAVTKTHTYNAFGNSTSTVTSASGLLSATINATYNTKGRYIIQQQNTGTGISQTNSFTVSSVWGLPLSKTTADCLTTSFMYDAFGRLNYSLLLDGNSVTISNVWNVSGNSLYYVNTNYAGGRPDTKLYFDKFGREWKSETVSINGAASDWHTVLTTYDNRGNVKTKTLPYFPASESARTTTSNFDQFNRVTSVVNDIGTTTSNYTITTDGKVKITFTNPASQTSSTTSDALGKIIIANDNGGQLDYKYDSWGNQIEVKNGSIVLVSSTYDEYGRQLTLTDKNAGTTAYTYNAYGQLSTQTNANGNSYAMLYDALGRLISKTGTEGVITYEYFKDVVTGCNNSSLVKVTGFNGVIKEYKYDALKRLNISTTTMEGVGYITSYDYNSYSQLKQTIYPSGIGIYNSYDDNGYLKHTGMNPDPNVTTNRFFYNGQTNGEGNYKSYVLGNGKTTNNTFNKGFPVTTLTAGVQNLSYNFQLTSGNLLQRNDVLNNQQEIFTYDNLYRLTSSAVNGVQQFGISYDGTATNSLGNINSKTDAGYYKYKSDKINAVAYTMNQPSSGQTAVTPAPISQISNAEQLVTYTPFLKTSTITEGAATLNFTYGPDNERIKTQLALGATDNVVETRYFLGSYEKKIANGLSSEIHYVSGGNGLCAIVVKAGGVVTPYIIYTDHLGSITTATNTAGTITAQQNFDAWGRRRNPANWNSFIPSPNTGSLDEGIAYWLYRGFTGHEMLPYFSLINMNGRMYDPILGRMLSPDNYIITPHGTQGYNRYSYAMNNPLSYVDPDGNFPWFTVALAAAISGVVKGIQYTESGQGTFPAGFWRGALIGGASAYLGTLAPIGMLPGMAYGAGTGALLGGLNGTLNGGNFWSGALTGGITGASLGGFIGGAEADNLGANILTGRSALQYSDPSIINNVASNSGEAPYTNDYLLKLYQKNFSKVNGLKTITKDNMPKGTVVQPDGTWLMSDGKTALAATKRSPWGHGRFSNVFFSRAAFQSKEALTVVMAHEMGHIIHNNLLLDVLAREPLLVTFDHVDNEGHLAIQKMTYEFIEKNGWSIKAFSSFQVQNPNELINYASKLYNPISFLSEVKITFPY